MRRYTRLSNGFSSKVENHMAAVALNYFAYDFIKIHFSIRMLPAMAAGARRSCGTWPRDLLIESESKKKPRSQC